MQQPLLMPCLMATLALSACHPFNKAPSESRAPQINPHPQQVVRIEGRMPPSLEARMFANYSIDDKHTRTGPAHPEVVDAACRPTLKYGLIPIHPDEYIRAEELKIERKGDRYETRFVVDRYLPGRCGWRFDGIHTLVAKDRNYDEAATLYTGIIFNADMAPEEPYCSSPWNDDCPAVSNADPTPVLVRCEMFDPERPGRKPVLMCTGFENIPYKRTHYVTPATKSIVVDFYDLTFDADPVIPAASARSPQ